MPHFDGALRAEMRDGNDFNVMERAICYSLKGADLSYHASQCGTVNEWGY